MRYFTQLRYRLFSQTEPVNELLVECVRKSIHLSSALIVVFARYWFKPTIAGMICVTVLYSVSEVLRMHNHNLPFIAKITRCAARPRDKGRFVLGPVTLACGVLAALLLFPFILRKLRYLRSLLGMGLPVLSGNGLENVIYILQKTKRLQAV